ncbi:MAG: Autotransporter-associated beta strand repeat protein, partial [Lacunisphaera sp.]|nr:Autotransporter-associated beta strand repeat protein [Lacunisphaera sp.]
TVGTGGSIINGDVAGRVMTVGGSGDIAINSVVGSNVGSIIKDGSGTVTLAGDYAANLTTSVNDGTLALAMVGSGPRGLSSATMVTIGDATGTAGSAVLLLSQSNQIADTAAVKLDTDGRLNVNGKTETVGSIASVTTTGTVGSILLGNGALSAGGANTSTIYAGTLAGAASSVFNKEGSGALTFSSNLDASPGDFAGTMNLNAGSIIFTASTDFTNNGLDTTDTLNVAAGTTLKLSDAVIKFANLNFTGTGTITLDFSGASSKLYSTNLNIAAGITLNIINWANAADFFYATNWTGAVLGTTGTGIENNVIFDAPTWTGANTKWQTYDHQITPVPEPSTYGAVLLGSMGALFGWRRIRSARPNKS